MNVSISIPKLLRIAAPAFRCGGITACLLYIFKDGISGLVPGLITVALCWIISVLSDAMVELYEKVEQLLNKQESE